MKHSYRFQLQLLFNFVGFKLYDFFVVSDEVRVSLKRTGKTGICPCCGKKRRHIEEVYERCVRDLDVLGKHCLVYFDEFKIRCSCGYRGVEKLEFVDKYRPYTERFEEYVARLCECMCLSDVAKLLGLNWKTVKDIDKKYLSKLVTSLEQVDPVCIGVDEISYRKGHKYLTVVRDLDIGRVIWTGRKRRKETLDSFFKELGDEKTRRICIVVMDMWDPYIASVKQNAPKADIVFDKFHIVKKVNEALDNVRRSEFRKADEKERKKFKKKRYLILSRQKRLDDAKRETLADLLRVNETLTRAYILKEQILDIMDEENVDAAMERLEKWFKNVHDSGVKQYEKVVETIRNYLYGVKNYFKYDLTNAASEGFNNKINVIKRRAYGFRDLEYFMLKILQSCGWKSS